MRRKIHKCLSFLLAAVLLASLAAPAALAAEGGDTVFVRTAEDLVQLAENCTLDSWSQGRIVRLEADIDLSGTDFTPIPTFGGTFEGQGHTISGLSITGSGNVRGLFRYIQPSGVVRDLSVEGRVDPSDRKNTLGGIAGSNRGLLAGCTFHGTVRGADSIGGLVGINESSGQIVNCTFSGAVTGEHYTGGIAGQNYGAVIQCRNSGSINTTEVDAELDLDAINREQLNAAENVPVCTDIGGVAGYSSGIIQSCTNSGSVGYDHVGYNIGGIVGRQSGYLDGCANSGDILGRKDVGGVAGQLEPEVRLLYDQGQMGELLDALDGLGDLLDQTQQDLRGTSDALSDRMDAISARTDEAREAVGDLADSAADWTNENIEELNSLTARISWLIDQLAPILDDAVDVMDLVEDLADELGNALDEVGAASGLGDQAEQELRAAVQSLRRAASSGKEAVARLLSALEHLGAALGSALQSQEAMEEVLGCRRGPGRRPRGHVRHAGRDRPHSVERRRRSGAGRGGSSPGGYTGQGGGCAGTGGERRRGPHGQRRAGRGREGRGGRMAGTGRGGSGPAGRRRTRHRRGSAAGKASGTGRRPGGSVSGPGQDVGESGFPGIPPRRGPGRRLLGAGRGAHHHHPSH
ncbi:MAG: GLUG motif-containing protein [Dysosmobacter sp.]